MSIRPIPAAIAAFFAALVTVMTTACGSTAASQPASASSSNRPVAASSTLTVNHVSSSPTATASPTRTAPTVTPSTPHASVPAPYLGSPLVGTWVAAADPGLVLTFDTYGHAVLNFGQGTATMQFCSTFNRFGVIDGHITTVSVPDPGLRVNGEVILGWRPHHWINLFFGPKGAQPEMFYKAHSVLPYIGTWYAHSMVFVVNPDGQATLAYRIYTPGRCPMTLTQRKLMCNVRLYLGRPSYDSTGTTFTVVGSFAEVGTTKGRFGFLNGSMLTIANPKIVGVLTLHLPVKYVDSRTFDVCDQGSTRMQPNACQVLPKGCERLSVGFTPCVNTVCREGEIHGNPAIEK